MQSTAIFIGATNFRTQLDEVRLGQRRLRGFGGEFTGLRVHDS